ncbi:hypothetical protein EZV73_11355 [Acidaminobacter sp. JC074]|uniref:prepilin peptidase n=1 Tax=Acidaminobacter sp. JC074 TaxID=2530199 RepID=UPI001F0F96EF|nr:prepilin peptidase [Acidaminobacter sp. JC074]MCH4888174.1 hypothetical protein [Acidaminobacter sp. JC074]
MIKILSIGMLGLFLGWLTLYVQYAILHAKRARNMFKCAACGNELTPRVVIPRLFPFYKHKICMRCHTVITKEVALLPVVSMIVLFVLNAYFKNLYQALLILILLQNFYLIIYFDIKYAIIPNVVIFSLVGVIMFHALFNLGQVSSLIISHMTGVLIAMTFSVVTFLIGKFVFKADHVLGMGDIKLMVLLGWLYGLVGISILLNSALVLGAIYGVTQMKKSRSIEIPFGPFLVCGAMLCMFTGQALIF